MRYSKTIFASLILAVFAFAQTALAYNFSIFHTLDSDFNGTPNQTVVGGGSVALVFNSGTPNFSYCYPSCPNGGGTYTAWSVPTYVSSIGIDMAGGSGLTTCGGVNAGKGGRVQTTLSVSPGSTINIYVGEGNSYHGYNGGGYNAGNGGGGGGASDIRIGGTTLSNRVVIGGGGGGTGACNVAPYGGAGGDGGYSAGSNGLQGPGGNGPGGGGGGGTQSSGGLGGFGGNFSDPGSNGELGLGGSGGSGSVNGGGGGGGGYYGGGGGGGGAGGGAGGGGGGSSFSSGTGTTYSTRSVTGNGYVNISYSGYYSSGTYTSRVIPAGGASNWGTISWTTTQPSGSTNIVLKARSCDDIACSGETAFSACNALVTISTGNGNVTGSTAISGNNCITNLHRFIQYEATLNGDTTTTPTLDNIGLDYNIVPDVIFSGGFKFLGSVKFW